MPAQKVFRLNEIDPVLIELTDILAEGNYSFQSIADGVSRGKVTVTDQTLYNWTQRKVKSPSVQKLRAVLRFLGYDLKVTKTNADVGKTYAEIIPFKRAANARRY